MKTRMVLYLLVAGLALSLLGCGAKTTAPTQAPSLETIALPAETTPAKTTVPAAPTTVMPTQPAVTTATTLPATTPVASETLPALTKPGTGGQIILPYVEKMAGVSGVFVSDSIRNEVNAWFDTIWASNSLDRSEGSIYDFVHRFNVLEADFRDQNSKKSEEFRYTDEEIKDIFNLSREEFINKYASKTVLIKGEHLYPLEWIAEYAASEWESIGITKDDVIKRLDELQKIDSEYAERIREVFGDKLN